MQYSKQIANHARYAIHAYCFSIYYRMTVRRKSRLLGPPLASRFLLSLWPTATIRVPNTRPVAIRNSVADREKKSANAAAGWAIRRAQHDTRFPGKECDSRWIDNRGKVPIRENQPGEKKEGISGRETDETVGREQERIRAYSGRVLERVLVIARVAFYVQITRCPTGHDLLGRTHARASKKGRYPRALTGLSLPPSSLLRRSVAFSAISASYSWTRVYAGGISRGSAFFREHAGNTPGTAFRRKKD